MKALWYVTKRSGINFMKKAVKKPTTYLFLAVIFIYAIILGSGAFAWRISGIFTENIALVTLLTIWTTFIFFTNFVTYAKKGNYF